MNIIIDGNVNNYINNPQEFILKIQDGKVGAFKKLAPETQSTEDITKIYKQIIGAAKLEDTANLHEELIKQLDLSLGAKNVEAVIADFLNEKEQLKNAHLAHYIFEKVLADPSPRHQRKQLRQFFDALAGEAQYRLHALCKYGNYPQIYEWIGAELDGAFSDTLDQDGHSPLYNLFHSFNGSAETVQLGPLAALLDQFQKKGATIAVATGQEKEYEAIFPHVCLYGSREYIEMLLTKMLQAGSTLQQTYGQDTPLYYLLYRFGYDLDEMKRFFEMFYPQFYAKEAYLVASGGGSSSSVLKCLLSYCFPQFRQHGNEICLRGEAQEYQAKTAGLQKQTQEYVAFIKSVVTQYPKLLPVTPDEEILESLINIDHELDGASACSLFSFFIEKGVKIKDVNGLLRKNPSTLIPLIIQHAEKLPEDITCIFEAIDFESIAPSEERREKIFEALFTRQEELRKNPKLARLIFERLLRTNFSRPKEALMRKFFASRCSDPQYMLHQMCQYGGFGLVRNMIIDELNHAPNLGLDPAGHSPLYNFFLSMQTYDSRGGGEYANAETVICLLVRKGATLAVAQGQERDFGIIFPYVCWFAGRSSVREMIDMILASGCALHEVDRGGATALYTLLGHYSADPKELKLFMEAIYPKFRAQKAFYLGKGHADTILSYLIIKLGPKIFESREYMAIIKNVVDLDPLLLNIEARVRGGAHNTDYHGSGNALNLLVDETMLSTPVQSQFRDLFAYFIKKGAKIVHPYRLLASMGILQEYDLMLLILDEKPALPTSRDGWTGWFNLSPEYRLKVIDRLLAYRETEQAAHIPTKDIFLISEQFPPQERKRVMHTLLGLTGDEVDLLPYGEAASEIQKALQNNVGMFAPEKIAYIATLFNDLKLAFALKQEIGRAAYIRAFETLAKKMPHVSREIETLIYDTTWSVSLAHLQVALPPLPEGEPEGEPEGANLRDIMPLFDTLREEDIDAIAEAASLPRGKEGRRQIRERLDDDIYRIENKKRRQRNVEPLPQDATVAQKELYYHEVKRARLWTVAKLKEKNDPITTRTVIAEYVIASPFCGTPFFQVSIDQFQNLMAGTGDTVHIKIHSALASLREHVMKQVALETACCADRDEPDPSHPNYYASQSTHFYNGLIRDLGPALGIPQATIFRQVSDPYPYFEQHYKRYHPTWKKDVLGYFFGIYSPSKIIETVTSRLEEISEDSLIDCVKGCCSETFRKAFFDKKSEEAQKLVTGRNPKSDDMTAVRTKKGELLAELEKKTGGTITLDDEQKSLHEFREQLLEKIARAVSNPITRQNANNFVDFWLQSNTARGKFLAQLHELGIGMELSDAEFQDAKKIEEKIARALLEARTASYLALMTEKIPGKDGLQLKVRPEGVLGMLQKMSVLQVA